MSLVEAQKSRQLNKYLTVFTVVTIIFLPPTFVAVSYQLYFSQPGQYTNVEDLLRHGPVPRLPHERHPDHVLGSICRRFWVHLSHGCFGAVKHHNLASDKRLLEGQVAQSEECAAVGNKSRRPGTGHY